MLHANTKNLKLSTLTQPSISKLVGKVLPLINQYNIVASVVRTGGFVLVWCFSYSKKLWGMILAIRPTLILRIGDRSDTYTRMPFSPKP